MLFDLRRRLNFSKMPFYVLATLLSVACTTAVQKSPSDKAARPNVLFIAVDDLNDWVGSLQGHPQARTPNIDQLASRGVLFTNAHTAAPACNPSRVALMTGLLPTSSGVYSNSRPWRPVLTDAVTLPQYFMAHGYNALGAGKIYDNRYPDPDSWNDYFPSQTKNKPDDPRPDDRPVNGIPKTRLFDWGPIDVDEGDMGDAQVADWVIQQLGRQHEKPFFLASGFYRPHLPWHVPRAYFDHYPLDSIQLPEVPVNDLEDIPPAGIAMANPEGDHKKVIEYGQWRNAVQGYLSSIEFADAQVGRVVAALDQSPHKHNTIVVLWSDHGWHLGEKSHWRKFALWERSTRVIFLVIAPGVTEHDGRSPRPVNLVDIYPTLIDLAGLPVHNGLDGVSLRPLLENPDTKWDRPSLTTHGRGNYAVRGNMWRYIRYADGSEELYNHETDDQEWHNLADDIKYTDVKKRLSNWIPETEAPEAPEVPKRDVGQLPTGAITNSAADKLHQ